MRDSTRAAAARRCSLVLLYPEKIKGKGWPEILNDASIVVVCFGENVAKFGNVANFGRDSLNVMFACCATCCLRVVGSIVMS